MKSQKQILLRGSTIGHVLMACPVCGKGNRFTHEQYAVALGDNVKIECYHCDCRDDYFMFELKEI